MPEHPRPSRVQASQEKGPHYALIKQKIPNWLSSAAGHRIAHLSTAHLTLPEWYRRTSDNLHLPLKNANAHSWRTQNTVDQRLSQLQDVYAFAEPLLRKAIEDEYELNLDVKNTFLHLYLPKQLPWYVYEFARGVTLRNVSLLDAALHNFADSETFDTDSCYISRPDYRGHFTTLALEELMSLEQFKALCRKLDLGARYQRHLETHLLPANAQARADLKTQVIASQKAAFKTAAQLARATGDLSGPSHAMLMRALNKERGVLQFYQLSILDAPLTGILLITADIESVSSQAKLLAYIPHDPESPLKEYDSTLDFMSDLTRKLQVNAPLPSRQHLPGQTYQQFFSQFVDHRQRGYFFAGLEQRLCKVQWHRKGPLDPEPSWRETLLDNPRLQFDVQRIERDHWRHLYQQAFNKILNDGRSIAVSTADADSNARVGWWDNFTRIITDIFNVAIMVAGPFIPFLGELMLAYTAYQLADEVLEGVVDVAEGQAAEAVAHFVAVANDLVQLGELGAGGMITQELTFKRSPFVDGLTAVPVEGGQRLWNPDLAPYAQPDLQLPVDAQPDELGLHKHQGQTVLRVEDQHYRVEQAPDATYRIKHPSRASAYSPALAHNSNGAWILEGEQPGTWGSTTLRQRLGPITEGLGPQQLEQACDISGTDDNALRMMYTYRQSPPPMLVDSLKRLKLHDQAERLPEQVRTGAPVDQSFYWTAQTASELPGWPADKAITVFEQADLTGNHMSYGASQPADSHTLKISQQDLLDGKLPQQILTFLSDSEVAALLPEPLPAAPADRVDALRNQLAERLSHQHEDIFFHLYSTSEALASPQGQLLQQQFPQLPKTLVDTLLIRASPNELTVMRDEQRIPLRLNNLARALANEARASRAFEGFYDDSALTSDTERMALNILRQHTDALGNLRIAVHERSPQGRLRCIVGAEDGEMGVLLRMDDGRYQIASAPTPSAHGQYSFYEALLRMVAADKIDYVPGQGQVFKQWLMEQVSNPAERCTILESPTPRQADTRTVETLLQRPMLGAFRRMFQRHPPSREQRVSSLLPHLDEAQVQEVLRFIDSQPDTDVLSTQEAAKRQLLDALESWRNKPTFGARNTLLAVNEITMRSFIIRELQKCWETGAHRRMSPVESVPAGTALDLSNLVLGRYVRSLDPLPADFSHVTRLNLSNTRLDNADLGFLGNFPQIRHLDLSDNSLYEVPQSLKNLPALNTLNLGDNPITWRPTDYQVLSQCTYLRKLNLEGHTGLVSAPDISNMPDLRRLVLRRTSISEWPAGLDSPRNYIPELDMTLTAVNRVPELPATSQAARTIAYSWLDRTKLEPADEDRFVNYRRSAGIDPYRTQPRGGVKDSQYWLQFLPLDTRFVAQQMWLELESEHGSQGFFDVLKLLRPPETFQTEYDAELFEQGSEDLASRIWELLLAVDRDPQFRDRMFSLAGAPANCADAGAHIFNRMGVETLLQGILMDTSETGFVSRESRLARLAKQSWHLELVNKLAHQEIQHRVAPVSEGGLGQAFGSGDNQVDDVQVYLAYQTGLKNRLDLPWLSEHMVYRETAHVTKEQLDATHRSILALEQGDGLADGLLDQPFWSDYLQDTYQDRFQTEYDKRATAGSLLEDLFDAHRQWREPQLPLERRSELRGQLLSLADDLKLVHSEVLTNEDFTDATVQRFYNQIQHDYKELARLLTRQALEKADHTH